MCKSEKGQSIVEFAIILPFFCLLLWGFVYFGMFFSDYLLLNHAARSSAREAALQTSETAVQDVGSEYFKKIKGQQVTNLYGLQTESDFSTRVDGADIVVVITERKNTDPTSSSLLTVFHNFLGSAVTDQFTITYRMYWEENPNKKN